MNFVKIVILPLIPSFSMSALSVLIFYGMFHALSDGSEPPPVPPDVPSIMGERPTERSLIQELLQYKVLDFSCHTAQVASAAKYPVYGDARVSSLISRFARDYSSYGVSSCYSFRVPGYIYIIVSTEDGSVILGETFIYNNPRAL